MRRDANRPAPRPELPRTDRLHIAGPDPLTIGRIPPAQGGAAAAAVDAARALEVRGLRTELSVGERIVVAVDGASFTVRPGETFALVGESGCGKSLTALSVLRLLPDNGRIPAGAVILGRTDILPLAEREMRPLRGRAAGIIFQEPATSLNPVLPVGLQVVEVIERHTTLRGAEARAKAIQWLERVGLPQPSRRFDDYPFQLSGGQKQRVMIAIALAAEPALLVADEPTTALDVTIQAQILDLLRELQRERGMAMLLITHDLGVVAGMARRVALMYAGQIVEVSDAADFFARPLHPYAQALLSALPQSAHRGTELAAIPGTVPPLDRPFTGCRFAGRCEHAGERCSQVPPDMVQQGTGRVRCLLHTPEGTGNPNASPQPGSVFRTDHFIPEHLRREDHTGDPSFGSLNPDSARAGQPRPSQGMTADRDAGAGSESPQETSPASRSARRATDVSGLLAQPRSQPQPQSHSTPQANSPPPPTASAMEQAAPLLELESYRVLYPQSRSLFGKRSWFPAVDGISLRLEPGRTLALVGESGCGKTTTGKALVQLLRETARIEGGARLAGVELSRLRGPALRAARRDLQIVFQDPYASLNPRMRVIDILEEGLIALRPEIGAAERRDRVMDLVQTVGLHADSVQRHPHEFSGGQRQRIAIARALAVEPRILVCDEPTSALDVSVQAQILNLLARLQRERGLAYLFITHNFGVVEYLADDVAVMRSGRILECGPARQVLEQPQDEYTRALLAAVPRVPTAA